MDITSLIVAARSGDDRAFADLVAPHRRELRAHCYRLAGSLHDADDLLQESLLKVWKGLGTFEGRSSLRSWLFRVTTNACLDALERKSARTLPSALGPPVEPDAVAADPLDVAWLEPCPDALWTELPAAPDAAIDARESVQLAFLVALQALPAKQRAVLILRDVVGFEASECASLLDLSLAAVNSALQRARETLARRPQPSDAVAPPPLLARYMDAWQRADPSALVALLREDATLAMPPLASWLRGADAIRRSLAAMVLGPAAVGRFRLVATAANGAPACAAYARGADGAWALQALHVLDVRDGVIAGIVAFLDPRSFAGLGLPATLSDVTL